ncbi:MAG: hypothetical protein HUU34_06065 [Saprospiraceae bacterium]|nr:hypothetical protein [Saprospiraceae bacterium]
MSNRHLIGRQILELRLSGAQEVPALQENLSKHYWQRISPAIERLFDRLAPPDELLSLDRLEINLGRLTGQELLSDLFIEKLLDQLEAAIVEALNRSPANAGRQPLRLGRFDLWLYFLERGALPPASGAPESAAVWRLQIFDTLALDANAVERLRRLLHTHPQALERLLLQYDTGFLQQIAGLFTSYKQEQLASAIREFAALVADLLDALHTAVRRNKRITTGAQVAWAAAATKALLRQIPALQMQTAWQADFRSWLMQYGASLVVLPRTQLQRQLEIDCWRIALTEAIIRRRKSDAAGLMTGILQHPAIRHWQPILQQLSQGALPKLAIAAQWIEALKAIPAAQSELSAASAPKRSEPLRSPQADEDLQANYIQNAGVVLLHPYLSRLFKHLELTTDAVFRDESSRQQAVFLLHYLATGEAQAPEYQLVLPKFLCGMPLDLPLDHALALSPEAMAEADTLLQAVIDNWGVLGKTSPDGLRQGFLQRAGILEQQSAGWQLRIERHTLDILLDRLPWNLRIVKLPWMPELLRVAWP